MTNPEHPLYLDGGRHNKIIRMGNEVHRPVSSWTNQIHQFLLSLREGNFFAAPIPLGFDSSGLEIVNLELLCSERATVFSSLDAKNSKFNWNIGHTIWTSPQAPLDEKKLITNDELPRMSNAELLLG